MNILIKMIVYITVRISMLSFWIQDFFVKCLYRTLTSQDYDVQIVKKTDNPLPENVVNFREAVGSKKP